MENDLKLAKEKIEAVFLVRDRKPNKLIFKLEGSIVKLKDFIKYLAIQIEKKITFTPHLKEIEAKAKNRLPRFAD